jgi:FkbM family methyltransferase
VHTRDTGIPPAFDWIMLSQMKTTCKKALKGLIGKFGFRILNEARMPYGIDECVDIARVVKKASIKTIFDVGANLGEVTERYCKQFPGAKLYAFEPIPPTFAELCGKLAHLSNVECCQLAFGSSEHRAQIELNANSEWNSLVTQLNNSTDFADNRIAIQVTTVDRFCEQNKIESIDLFKTDTEGYDLEVLKGATGLLKSRKIKFVFTEIGLSSTDIRHTNFYEISAFLTQFNFRCLALYEVVSSGDTQHWGNALYMRLDE